MRVEDPGKRSQPSTKPITDPSNPPSPVDLPVPTGPMQPGRAHQAKAVRAHHRTRTRLHSVKHEDFSALVRARHTVRDFRPDPIEQAKLNSILDDARHCPSWSNTRPYRIAIASGERLERLRAAYTAEFDRSLGMQQRNKGAIVRALLTGGLPDGDFRTWKRYPDDLRPASVKVGKALYTHIGVPRHDRAARDAYNRRNCEFFDAPTVLWLFAHKKLLPFSAQDAGLMLQTLMLSAQAHGVGSCPLGVLATWRRPVDAEFEIPGDYKLLTGLALGYATDHHINDFRAEHPELIQLPPR